MAGAACVQVGEAKPASAAVRVAEAAAATRIVMEARKTNQEGFCPAVAAAADILP